MPETLILVVEDTDSDRELIKRVLEQSLGGAMQVVFCESLKCARREFASRSVDVVVLDLSLPDAKGVQAVREIRSLNPEIPIVVCTGIEDEAVRLQSIANGALQFIPKGAGYAALPAAVVSGLEVRRRGQLAMRAFSQRLQAIHATTIDTAQDVRKVKEGVHQLSHAVFGNGEPDKGLTSRVKENERFRDITLKIAWIIVGAGITAIIGGAIAWII